MTRIDVELKNVSKRFGGIAAVNDVSFTIEKGEFFSLLGPSGCGKTTILRMISGFEQPTEGDVFIAGAVITPVPAYKRPTNLVFQHLSLFPHMSVVKNIGFGLEMKGASKAEIRREVDRMLELIELGGFGDRRIHQLSGGQQQRVAIARALINNPTVLLLDEPLGALDLKLRNQMQLELKRIQKEVGTTFVYVTHDQGEALTMSDRIAVMNHGIIEQIGKSDEIYEIPKTVFVANFIGETNLIEGVLSEIDGSGGTLTSNGLSINVMLQENLTKGQKAFVSVRPEKIEINKQLSGLENIFNGTVVETIYQGLMSVYTIMVEGRIKITVRVQNVDSTKRFSEGLNVQIGWDVEKGIVITEDQA